MAGICIILRWFNHNADLNTCHIFDGYDGKVIRIAFIPKQFDKSSFDKLVQLLELLFSKTNNCVCRFKLNCCLLLLRDGRHVNFNI